MQKSLRPSATAQTDRTSVWHYIFAGLSASLVSIGLARFAFTPLIPELIHAHWFSTAAVIYLGPANLAGYVIGALLGRPISSRFRNEHTLRLMMIIITATFVACAVPLSFAWYFGWRFLSGVAGGVVMVLVAATIMPHVPNARRGLAGGAIFLGLGLGIAGSGTIVPLLLNFGLRQTWLGLAIVSALLTAGSWFAWPSSTIDEPGSAEPVQPGFVHAHFGPRTSILYTQYALMAIGCVPTMVFLVDFISRGLGAGTHVGSIFWVLYGVGAIFGPPSYGLLADRLGPRPAVRLLVLIQALAMAGLCLTSSLSQLAVLTVIVGTFAPGIVPLMLARVRETIPHSIRKQNIAWSRATVISAAAMATTGYAYSALLNISGGNHRLLFLTAAVLLVVALLGDLGIQKRSDRASTVSTPSQ